jgi:uncharacterized protein YfaS (alpha-2-macroglobulin family)
VHFPLEARDRIAIPKDMLDSGNGFLRQSPPTMRDARRTASAIRLSPDARASSRPTTSLRCCLDSAWPETWKSDLIAAWLAASYRMLAGQASECADPAVARTAVSGRHW